MMISKIAISLSLKSNIRDVLTVPILLAKSVISSLEGILNK